MKRSRLAHVPLILLACGFALGCQSEVPTAAPASPSLLTPNNLAFDSSIPSAAKRISVLGCSSITPSTVAGTFGPRGGVLKDAYGNQVVIPPGALRERIRLTLSVPAGRELKVDIVANGAEHYTFRKPIAVTISYAACRRQKNRAPIAVWHVDTKTGAPLEYMGGIDDRARHAVTFLATHLSTYCVAF